MSHTANIPDFRVTLDGRDLTSRMRPRLVELTLSEKRGGEADQLDITLSDAAGDLAIPKPGATLTLAIGWKRGSDVMPGLVDKGTFIVDSVEHSGPPDTLTLRAKSADLTSNIRTRREQSWKDATIGEVVREVAGRNGLQPRVAEALGGVQVKLVAQSRESDMALLRRLGREHDAVATIKQGALIFAPVGAGMTATGKPIPAATIRRRDGDRHSYSVEKQDESTGVEASYHDLGSAEKKTVTAGDTKKVKKLSRTYSSEAAAQAAAKAEHSRTARLPVKLSFDLALARPDLYPERRLTVAGFKAEIDATQWLIAEVSHRLGSGGFTTSLQMESA